MNKDKAEEMKHQARWRPLKSSPRMSEGHYRLVMSPVRTC